MGLNLAIVYGFALIKMAFVLSLIYGLMCRAEPSEASEGETSTEVDASREGQE